MGFLRLMTQAGRKADEAEAEDIRLESMVERLSPLVFAERGSESFGGETDADAIAITHEILNRANDRSREREFGGRGINAVMTKPGAFAAIDDKRFRDARVGRFAGPEDESLFQRTVELVGETLRREHDDLNVGQQFGTVTGDSNMISRSKRLIDASLPKEAHTFRRYPGQIKRWFDE